MEKKNKKNTKKNTKKKKERERAYMKWEKKTQNNQPNISGKEQF